MLRTALSTLLLLGSAVSVQAQQARYDQDPKLNNLVHDEGYVTAPLGTLGRVTEMGSGDRDMILIAGAGFGGEIYESFMKSRTADYRMFAVTLPGFGGTAAPPMPAEGTSYGEQTWTRSAMQGIEALIAEKKMTRPILVTHLRTSTQIALTMALKDPDKFEAVVLIAGMPRFTSTNPATSPDPTSVEQRVQMVDKGFAPQWFKTVTRDTWDDNNYLPGDYAQHPLRALQLWRQAAEPPLPVLIRYLCEFWAQDITEGLDELRVPTLLLQPGLDEDLYIPTGRNYMKAFFQDSWDGVDEASGGLLSIRKIENSRAFIMDDQPEALNEAVNGFLEGRQQER